MGRRRGQEGLLHVAAGRAGMWSTYAYPRAGHSEGCVRPSCCARRPGCWRREKRRERGRRRERAARGLTAETARLLSELARRVVFTAAVCRDLGLATAPLLAGPGHPSTSRQGTKAAAEPQCGVRAARDWPPSLPHVRATQIRAADPPPARSTAVAAPAASQRWRPRSNDRQRVPHVRTGRSAPNQTSAGMAQSM